MSQWTCQVGNATPNSAPATPDASTTVAPDPSGASSGDLASDVRGLTVGQTFQLVCHGDSIPFLPANLKIETKGAEPKSAHFYQLQLIKLNQATDTSVDAVVASFETGDHDPKDLVLTDGTHSVDLVGFHFDVQSVLQKESGQPPQPFGPVGPFKLSWSWTLIAPVLIFLLLLILLALRYFRNRVRQKNWAEEIKSFKTARRPLDELLGDVRALDRKFDFNQDQTPTIGKDLRHLFDVFLVRTFQVAAHRLSPSQTLQHIRKKNGAKASEGRVSDNTLLLVQKTMVELRSLENRTGFIPASDIQQIVRQIRKVSDLVVADHDRRSAK